MPYVNAKEMLADAKRNHYAVGHFNLNNMESVRAFLLAAEEQRSPIILGVSGGTAKYMGGYKTIADMVRDFMDFLKITVPVCTHVDHGTYEEAMAAIDGGFSSVMFDGSKYPIEENIAKTREVVRRAHEKGITVEAEVGAIGGEEDGRIAMGECADPEQCERIASLGIDFLAAGSIPPTGPACVSTCLTRSSRRPATCPWSCTAAAASPTRWSARPSPWASARSTSTPNARSPLRKRPARTSKRARTARAKASPPAPCWLPAWKPPRPSALKR